MSTVVFIERPPSIGFSAVDLELLRRHHDVVVVPYPGKPTVRFVRAVWRGASAAEVGYTFFASEHALMAAVVMRLRRRRFVVAVGGYDTANDPAHGYGLAARRRGFVPRTVVRLATALVAHSAFAATELRALSPRVGNKVTIAHLAIDVASWADPGVERRADRVVTLARVTRESFRRKGIDRFVELARSDPTREYVLAGAIEADASPLIHDYPPNFRVTGVLEHEALRQLLWSSGVYAQLSWHETFGAAVAEAMACGCIPLITDQPALIEITGGHGLVVSEQDPAALLLRLDQVDATAIDRQALRDHVATSFTTERRLAALDSALALGNGHLGR